MTKTTAIEIHQIPIAEIEVEARLRDASPTGVNSIVSSILEIGEIMQPLILRKMPEGYRLLDGLHRLRAAEQVGLDVVPAHVRTCSNNDAVRIEVDANLAGAPLNALDMAVFLAEHQRLYELENPQAAHGHAGAAARWNANVIMSVASFSANAAEVFGKNERTIQRLIKVGKNLSRADIGHLRDAPQKVQFKDLELIAKCGDPAERSKICAALGDGSAKSAKEVLERKKAPGAKALSPSDQHYAKLLDAWARAPKAAQRSFIRDKADELRELLGDLETETAEVVSFSTHREVS